MKNNYIKATVAIISSVVLLVVVWLGLSWFLLIQSTTLVFQNQVSWASVPESPSLQYKITWLKNSQNNNFSVWEFQNPSTDQYVIYTHGNAGRLLNFFPSLTSKYNAISPAYPGYSESESNPSQEKSFEAALLTYDWLVNTKGIKENKITIFGHSLGGSVATYLASKKPNAKELVLVNTFSSVQSMCIRSYGPFCVFAGGVFNSSEMAKNVTIPLRHFAYKNDTTIPFEENKKLFESFKSNDKVFYEMSGYTHSYPNFTEILPNI